MSEKGYKISRFAELFSLEILNKAGDYASRLRKVPTSISMPAADG